MTIPVKAAIVVCTGFALGFAAGLAVRLAVRCVEARTARGLKAC